MAAQTLTGETLTANARSTDLVAGANMVSCAAGDTFTIPVAVTKNKLRSLVIVAKGSGSATITINAGDYPPSARRDLVASGGDTFSIANAEVRILPLDSDRYLQNDGTVTGSVASATVLLGCFRLPELG